MPVLLLYILKLSVSLAVMFVFYQLVLRKLTFYNWNRWYLLGYSVISFLIAFIDISPVLEQHEWSGNNFVQWVPVLQQQSVTPLETSVQSISTWDIIRMIIVAGMLFMFLRLLVQLLSFRRMIRKAKPLQTGSIPGTNLKLYQVDDNIIPFSFGNAIFINHSLHSHEELKEIVWHEFIHVKQKHSVDIIWGELLCLLNWYNPFAWLIRRSIRQNLEFIADNKVLENGVGRKEYQYLLLKVIGNNHFSIAPKFNFSSLKKRIAMMNKMKSAGVHIVKFLFILPLVAVLLVAFRDQHPEQQTTLPKDRRIDGIIPATVIDTVPFVTTPNSKGYFIDVIGVDGECTVVVKDKNKKEIERVVLNKWKEDNRYEAKYGEILVPPPPPPSPVDITMATPSSPAVPPVPPASCYSTTTPPPAVAGYSIAGNNVSRIAKEFEITDKKAWLKLADGTIENYDLSNKNERDAFEKKYGLIVNVNPAVATNINTTVRGNVNANANTNINVNGTISTTTIAPAVVAGQGLSTTVAPGVIRTSGEAMTVIAPTAASGVMIVDDAADITGDEDVVVTITRSTTRQELDKFVAQMKEKGVELTFDDIEYNDKGKLVSINGTMKGFGSRSNFVVSDFKILVLAMVKKGDKTYFKVRTTDNEVI